VCALVLAAFVATGCGSSGAAVPAPSPSSRAAAAIGGPAPDFSLFDQFDHLRRLSEFRGKVVLLTFADSRCTTICPLTADLLRRTLELLGTASDGTQLLAVNTDYRSTSVQDVLRWSKAHSMTHRWLFLTGLITRLIPVWHAYGVTGGDAHTTAVFVIDARGTIRSVVPIATRSGIDGEARALASYVARLDAA
jgi:cytochrome oxidase Cu insertion factor (SCO1/SenC/PrrC family)